LLGIFFVIEAFVFYFLSFSFWMLVIASLLQGLAFAALQLPAISYYVKQFNEQTMIQIIRAKQFCYRGPGKHLRKCFSVVLLPVGC